MNTCRATGCPEPAIAQGLCGAHWRAEKAAQRHPPWRTARAVELCERIQAEADYGLLPDLAAELTAAGYPDVAELTVVALTDPDLYRIHRLLARVRWGPEAVQAVDRLRSIAADLTEAAYPTPTTYADLVTAMAHFDETGEAVVDRGTLNRSNAWYDFGEKAWRYWEIATGRRPKDPAGDVYRCKC